MECALEKNVRAASDDEFDSDSSSLNQNIEEKKKRKLLRRDLCRRIVLSVTMIPVVLVICFLAFYLPYHFAEESNVTQKPIDYYNQVGWMGGMIGATLPILGLSYFCSKKCWKYCFKSCYKKCKIWIFSLSRKEPIILRGSDIPLTSITHDNSTNQSPIPEQPKEDATTMKVIDDINTEEKATGTEII